jgi:antitoxin HigA-1
MPMKNPAHPGRIVRHDCLEPLGLSVTEGAEVLGVSRQTLNNVIHGKSGISPEMAIRLSKAFGSTPETWLRMQLAYDLAQARKDESKIKVRRQQVQRSDPADGRLDSIIRRAVNDEKNGRLRPL